VPAAPRRTRSRQSWAGPGALGKLSGRAGASAGLSLRARGRLARKAALGDLSDTIHLDFSLTRHIVSSEGLPSSEQDACQTRPSVAPGWR
jgi:hypothetical protein